MILWFFFTKTAQVTTKQTLLNYICYHILYKKITFLEIALFLTPRLDWRSSVLLPSPVCWYRRPAVQRGIPCSKVGSSCGTFPGQQCPISQSEATRPSDVSPGSCKHLSRAETVHTELKITICSPWKHWPWDWFHPADGKGFFTTYRDPTTLLLPWLQRCFWEPSTQRSYESFKAILKQRRVDGQTCNTLYLYLSHMVVL